jgi:hypothetical protein
MNRREFLKDTGTLLAGSVLLPNNMAEGQQRTTTDNPSRMIFPMNRNWRFDQFVEGGHTRACSH